MHRSVSVTNLHTGNQTKDQRAAGRRSPEKNRRAGRSIGDRTRSHTEPRRRRSRRLGSLEENTGTTQQKPAAFRIEKGGRKSIVLETLRSTTAMTVCLASSHTTFGSFQREKFTTASCRIKTPCLNEFILTRNSS